MFGRAVVAAVARRGAWLAVYAGLAGCGESERGPASAGENAGTGGASSGGVGAGGSAGTAATGGDVAMAGAGSFERFPGEYARALCALIERCWPTFDDSYQATGQSCAGVLEPQLREGPFANLAPALADGRVEYRAGNAQACLDAIAALSCEADLDRDLLDYCEELLVGSLPAGANCTIDAECADGMQCVVGESCPGTCGPRAELGAACTSENRCQAGLICSIDAQERGTCTQQAGPGESCSSSQSCPTFYACLGLDSSDPASTGTCEPRDALFSGKLDEPCALAGASARLCEPPLVCSLGDARTGVCSEPVASGEACTMALPEPCPAGEYCRITDVVARPLTGVCSKAPALGEACANPGGLPVACPANAYCNEQTGLCEAQKRVGETCGTHDACFSRACVNQKCAAPLECEPEPT